MMPRELDTVLLQRELPDAGLRPGDLEAVVHVHPDGMLDVEFVRASGRTQALITLAAADVRAVQDADIPAVRPVDPHRGAT